MLIGNFWIHRQEGQTKLCWLFLLLLFIQVREDFVLGRKTTYDFQNKNISVELKCFYYTWCPWAAQERNLSYGML